MLKILEKVNSYWYPAGQSNKPQISYNLRLYTYLPTLLSTKVHWQLIFSPDAEFIHNGTSVAGTYKFNGNLICNIPPTGYY
jgi:hypothetical protein